MPRKQLTSTGAFTVGGDERPCPTAGFAFSRAINFASTADGPRQFGVYENGSQIGRVVRHEDGLITIHTLNGKEQ